MEGCYGVKFVRDDELPPDVEWALAETWDGETFLFVKRRAVCPRVLAESWAAYRQLARGRRVATALPLQFVPQSRVQSGHG